MEKRRTALHKARFWYIKYIGIGHEIKSTTADYSCDMNCVILIRFFIFDMITLKIVQLNQFCFKIYQFFLLDDQNHVSMSNSEFSCVFEQRLCKWQCFKSRCNFLHHPIYRKVALYSRAAKWFITPYKDKKVNFNFNHLHCSGTFIDLIIINLIIIESMGTLHHLVTVAEKRVHLNCMVLLFSPISI